MLRKKGEVLRGPLSKIPHAKAQCAKASRRQYADAAVYQINLLS